LSCPPAWIRALAAQFRDRFPAGEVAINRPFPGGFTPMAHYWHRGVPWVAVELNRCLYEGAGGAIEEGAIEDLRERCWDALAAFWEQIEDADL
jgi:formiminoglutamase